ncbi:50S ribosomal protein L6 [Buchnera aphidicola]|uniref:50S ribosomal protein L6 n=1 Tax=Buchnera aphidicola subsp. Tuberolachnus salignus TaxID=98804 RepID=A0A160SZC0_BUCTT|nr:50S ribosomal protein L6 [Buchnera aphidicola]CUR53306.1 50S ribosomal protein L6 [Buchnera aphidicola (Tuberolachnus salignus)]
MSRLAKVPIEIPENIVVLIKNNKITVTGQKGTLTKKIHKNIVLTIKQKKIFFSVQEVLQKNQWMQAGTCRSLVKSMIYGIQKGFVKKLQFLGVGYRIILEKFNLLKMLLGFSHPIFYTLPKEVSAKILPNNELELISINKQLVGQVASNIRSYRIPEPYKGKGIRYFNEKIRLKEAKKK